MVACRQTTSASAMRTIAAVQAAPLVMSWAALKCATAGKPPWETYSWKAKRLPTPSTQRIAARTPALATGVPDESWRTDVNSPASEPKRGADRGQADDQEEVVSCGRDGLQEVHRHNPDEDEGKDQKPGG